MNHWQEMGEGGDCGWNSRWLSPWAHRSLLFLPPAAGSVHSFQGWWRRGGELGLLSGTNM